MNSIVNITKDLFTPSLKGFKKDIALVPDEFWYRLTNDLIYYEIDDSMVFLTLKTLETTKLKLSKKQLFEIYSEFIKKLAAEYILGRNNEIINKLLENRNETFHREVILLSMINSSFSKADRKIFIKKLSTFYEYSKLKLDNFTLETVIKKKSREDMKIKFKKWDDDLI